MAKESGQMTNDLSKYFYTKTDGAYKIKRSGNMVDIWMRIYYQVPTIRKPGGGKEEFPLQEMILNINMTSYANKMRVNMIEVSPEEQTLGHFVLPTEKLIDLEQARQEILKRIRRRLDKMFEGYEFIY